VLHGVVTEARARRQRGETPGADRWREDLQPREAMRARTIPTLERERDLLRARLAQVRRPKKLADRVTLIAQMEKENMELYDQVQENVAAQERTDAKTAEMFAFFDEVRAITLCPSLAGCALRLSGRLLVRSTRNGGNCHWKTCRRGCF